MQKKTLSEQERDLYRHLSFYLHEKRKWTRTVAKHICWTIPFIALTILAAYKEKPFLTMVGAGAGAIGIKRIQKANFYRRRSACRVQQQKITIQAVKE